MGAGASQGVALAIKNATAEDIQSVFDKFGADERLKVLTAVEKASNSEARAELGGGTWVRKSGGAKRSSVRKSIAGHSGHPPRISQSVSILGTHRADAETSSTMMNHSKEKPAVGPTDLQHAEAEKPCGAPGDLLRGLSVHFWHESLPELMMVPEGSTKKVYDIEPQIRELSKSFTCPRDRRPGAAYVDCAPDPDAGQANLMLSYSWGYEVRLIIRSLLSYCERDGRAPKEVRVWVCCMCINQHRVKEAWEKGECIPFEEFQDAFGRRVCGIGQVLALVSPWCCPIYTSRVWCVYELYVATKTKDVKLDFALPPEERQDFETSFRQEGLKLVWDTLSKMQVRKAQASVQSDRQRILELVERGPGFATLDKAVSQRMQEWFLHAANERLNSMLSDTAVGKAEASQVAAAGSQIIELHIKLGQIAEALAAGSALTAYISDTGAEATIGAARCTLWIGEGLFQQGQLHKAREEYARALSIFEAADAGQSADAATCIAFTGGVLIELDEIQEALVQIERALSIYESAGLAQSTGAAGCTVSLGTALWRQDRSEEAMEKYKEALAIYEAAGAGQTPDAAVCVMSIGNLVLGQSEPQNAIVHFRKALAIYEASGSGCSPDAATCILAVGDALSEQGQQHEAVAEYRLALAIYEEAGAGKHPDAAGCMLSMAFSLEELGENQQALAEYEKALAIQEAAGVDTSDTRDWIAELSKKGCNQEQGVDVSAML